MCFVVVLLESVALVSDALASWLLRSLLLPLSLSYDHRVIDGAAAARFTAYLAQLLGDMRRVLL